MKINYIEDFPIPEGLLPEKLKLLLKPISEENTQDIEVTTFFEDKEEVIHMLTITPPRKSRHLSYNLYENQTGLVFSVDDRRESLGFYSKFSPLVDGKYDYVVASSGDGQFFSYSLSEKVWMLLGLTPRCIGGDKQELIYDDPRAPEMKIAYGPASMEYHYNPKRNVHWKMSSKHLKHYLWLRGAKATRIFFYQSRIIKSSEIVRLIGEGSTKNIKSPTGIDWYSIDLINEGDQIIMRVWASIDAVCPKQNKDYSDKRLSWPGINVAIPMNQGHLLPNDDRYVYLNDKFLEKYEENSYYDSTPFKNFGHWYCNPGYKGYWGFTDCKRVGRNLIKVQLRELYKPKSVQELMHAHKFSENVDLGEFDFTEEHIVSKVDRFVVSLIRLGKTISELRNKIFNNRHDIRIIEINGDEQDSWTNNLKLKKLAHIAPLDMSQASFLRRCKSIHEIWQTIPDKHLREILKKSGCDEKEIGKLKQLKLIQSLLNVVTQMNSSEEEVYDFCSTTPRDGWDKSNESIWPLFMNAELRNAEAHDSAEIISGCIKNMEEKGFDSASLRDGYGRALDFVLDGVIDSINLVSNEIEDLLNRSLYSHQ